jgi:hypothetical protein
MPSVPAPSERREEVDGHILPGVRLGFWRTWAQSLGRSHAQRSPRTPRSCALTHHRTRETLMELVARQSPYLYSQTGTGV